ncbi:hypothetical protein J2S50_007091 [Streptomyces sp. DSM 40167]|nr:hypothetical protein [Streptomyces sp. DSM 40167]
MNAFLIPVTSEDFGHCMPAENPGKFSTAIVLVREASGA